MNIPFWLGGLAGLILFFALFLLLEGQGRFQFPFVIFARVNHEYRERCRKDNQASAEREIARLCNVVSEKRAIIEQNAQVQESQRRHISALDQRIVDGGEQNKRLIATSQELRQDLRMRDNQLESERFAHGKVVEQMRKEYAGDLQLERTRFDEFVRDYLDRITGTGAHATAAAPRSSSRRERELPPEVQQAIEDVCFGNVALEAQQEREAWRRLKEDGSNATEVAEAIRRGESPE